MAKAAGRKGSAMIIEKLMKQTDFTKVEKSIADYLMKNGFDVKNMSIQTLAHETFTSPSTITRFCKKLGLDGYKKFQILFYSEYEVYASQGAVDANYPSQEAILLSRLQESSRS